MKPVTRANLAQTTSAAILIVLAMLTLLPFGMTVLMSQKTNGEILNSFWRWPQAFHPEYYAEAFRYLYGYIVNTLLIGVFAVVGTAFISSLAGYVFARIDFRGKRFLFLMVLALMMIPGVLTLIPSFLWFKEFPFAGGNDWLGRGGRGFLNSRWVLILPYISGGQIFGIFLCRSFFETLPESLFEAARIDGASEFQVYRRIAMPLSLPIVATLAVMNFVGVYNDYIWPLVTISDKRIQTFSVGILSFGIEGNLDAGPVLAGYLIGSIPLICVFAFGMKYYVEGLTKGALKA